MYCTRALGELQRKAENMAVDTPLPLQDCNNVYRPRAADAANFLIGKPTEFSTMDAFFIAADSALRTLFAKPRASAACATLPEAPSTLDEAQKRKAAGLMRVNHVGEVCAQALYASQALATRSPALRRQFNQASADEIDHLAWTAERLQELGSRPSLLNPLWYAGAFGLGLLAGRMGDAISLGFVAETETQVGAHLKSHLDLLPAGDHASRAIVAQMHEDEMRHAREAEAAGAAELPQAVKQLMRGAAKVMTTVAERI